MEVWLDEYVEKLYYTNYHSLLNICGNTFKDSIHSF